jgi:Flp pilus assembly protein TadG
MDVTTTRKLRRTFSNKGKHVMTNHSKFVGFLKRLRTDTSGNALMIGAAAMFPLIGIAGGAVDMSRIYAVKTRLQHACDASVLASRQAMTSKTWTTDAETVGKQFFDINFPEGKYGTTFPIPGPGQSKGINFAPNLDGSVKAIAEAVVPMSLMQVFGYTENKVQVDCKAQINLPNTDVMMVLDTTGSMGQTNPTDTKTRFEVMQESVSKFHQSLNDANAAGSAVRFGFVPYSSTVNVGGLLKPEWIADKWKYQSRKPDGFEVVNGNQTADVNWVNSEWSTKSGSRTDEPTTYPGEGCAKVTVPSGNVVWGGDKIVDESVEALSASPFDDITKREREWSANGTYYSAEETAAGCVVWKTVFTNYVQAYTQTGTPESQTALWEYDELEYNTSSLNVVGSTIQTPIGNNHAAVTVTWNGCIEERQTVADPIGRFANVPADAFDLQIDKVPDADPKTQWGPMLPRLIYAREGFTVWNRNKINKTSVDFERVDTWGNGAYVSCPSPAKNLSPMSSTEVTTYLGGLQPSGRTYHDIGMIWGARLLSPTGLFKDQNTAASARHLIFMTDGETDTAPQIYGAYGWSALDRRQEVSTSVVPTKAAMDALTEERFAAVCRATRAKGITIWVIAFGTAETQMLKDCAGSDDRSFKADSQIELGAAFNEIAGKIAHLRLVE